MDLKISKDNQLLLNIQRIQLIQLKNISHVVYQEYDMLNPYIINMPKQSVFKFHNKFVQGLEDNEQAETLCLKIDEAEFLKVKNIIEAAIQQHYAIDLNNLGVTLEQMVRLYQELKQVYIDFSKT